MKLHELEIGSRFESCGQQATLLNVMNNHAWADVRFDGKTNTYISAGTEVKPIIENAKIKKSFVYNDGGRKEAGRKGNTGDCVTRAICITTGLPYMEVYNRLAEGNSTQRKSKHDKGKRVRTASNGINVRRKWFRDYMKELGFKWTPTMFIGSGCKVHVKSSELPSGKLVLSLSKHWSSMIDGVINDTYDCSRNGTRCVYGYWKLSD